MSEGIDLYDWQLVTPFSVVLAPPDSPSDGISLVAVVGDMDLKGAVERESAWGSEVHHVSICTVSPHLATLDPGQVSAELCRSPDIIPQHCLAIDDHVRSDTSAVSILVGGENQAFEYP